MEYHSTSKIAIVGNKIEQGIVIPMIKSWTMLVPVNTEGKGTSTFKVQRLKELHRMHRGHHGYPDLIDDHLPERSR
jgi:hypothetical protein